MGSSRVERNFRPSDALRSLSNKSTARKCTSFGKETETHLLVWIDKNVMYNAVLLPLIHIVLLPFIHAVLWNPYCYWFLNVFPSFIGYI